MARIRTRIDPKGLNTFGASVELWNRPRNWRTGLPTGEPAFFSNMVTGPFHWTPNTNQVSQQITVDENHTLYDPSSLRGGLYDVGGPFDSQRFGIRCSAPNVELRSHWGYDADNDPYHHQNRYHGPVFAYDITQLTAGTPTGRASESTLRGEGTSAISRCKPTNHISDLANDLTEILHGQAPKLPGRHLWKAKTQRAKLAGGDYLNVVFGWLPLVSDVRDAAYAAANSERLMKTYEENSGKPVRRRYSFPVEETVVSTNAGPNEGHIGMTGNWNSSGYLSFLSSTTSMPNLIITTRHYRSVWFSGCFVYYLPVTYKSRERIGQIAAKAAHLYGVELTPKVLWDVTPWTWAIDWFSNAGDVVGNLSDWQIDGLVMSHGYLMEHVLHETTYELDRPTRFMTADGGYANASPVSTYYESKRRLKASPFGFDLNLSVSSLSLRQWAIAVALGLTKFAP